MSDNKQSRKGIKPTREEHAERIGMVRKMWVAGWPKRDIKRAMRSRYGVGFRSVEKYLARVKDQLLEDLGRDADEHRSDALAFYKKLLVEADSDAVRLKAMQSICRLLGLNMPEKLAQTDSQGRDLSPSEREQRLLELIEIMRSRQNLEPSEN